MTKCYFYFPVEPLIEHYRDDKNVKPEFIIPVQKESKEYEIAIFSTKNQIYMVRIMIPNVDSENYSENDAKVVQTLKEHMASVLRITYDHGINIYDKHYWTFIDDEKEPNVGVEIKEFINPDFRINSENIRATFITTFPVRNQIKLFSDSQDKRIPLQYRYLSLYKILELEFKIKGKWKEPDISKFLSKFESEFFTLKITNKKLKNYIHDLRDRCAHIKSSKEVLGVNVLNNKDTLEINKFILLMIKICAVLLNEKYKDKGFELVGTSTFLKELNKKQEFVI